MFLRFEDLVYNYEESICQIEDFLNISNRNNDFVKKFFSPEKSKKNIGKYKLYKNEYKEAFSSIERELKEFLYL